MGWAGVKNGELLDLAEGKHFEALVTTDQSLRHQQNISLRKFGVIVHDAGRSIDDFVDRSVIGPASVIDECSERVYRSR